MAFWWLCLCLSVMLGGCSAHLTPLSSSSSSSSSSDGLVASSAVPALLALSSSPAPMVTENLTLTASHASVATRGRIAEGPSVRAPVTATTASSVPPAESSSTPGVVVTAAERGSDAPARSTRKKATPRKDDLDYQALDGSFHYDYGYLRRVGLGLAFVFFVTGILVIASSRVSRIPRCRSTAGKSYEVTRV